MKLKDHPAGTIEELAEFTQKLCKRLGLPRVRISLSKFENKTQGSYSPITCEIIFYTRIFREKSFNDYKRRAIAAHELTHHYLWTKKDGRRLRSHGKEFSEKEREVLSLLEMQPVRSKGVNTGYLRALTAGKTIVWAAKGYTVKNGFAFPDVSFNMLCLSVQLHHEKKNVKKIRFYLPHSEKDIYLSYLPYNLCSNSWIPQTWFIKYKHKRVNLRELFPKGITQIIFEKKGEEWAEQGSDAQKEDIPTIIEEPHIEALKGSQSETQPIFGQLTLF